MNSDEQAFRALAHQARLEASLARARLQARGITDPSQWAAVKHAENYAAAFGSLYAPPPVRESSAAVFVAASAGKASGQQPFTLPQVLCDPPLPPYAA